MKPLLILGAGGMLGRAWVERCAREDRPATGLDRAGCDVTVAAQVAAALEGEWAAVINCAAYTDVDGAEADEARATRVNGEAIGILVEACDAARVPLVTYSTDYVFDGAREAPYPVDHPTAPINAYGRSKVVGERHVAASGGPHLLIRTSWLYAPWGRSFVRTIAERAAAGAALSVVDDQRGRPTSAEDLAEASLRLLDRGARGTYHVAGGGTCSWYELAVAIVELLGASAPVTPCESAAMPRPAPRPARSVLDLSKTEAVLGPRPPWRRSLGETLGRMER